MNDFLQGYEHLDLLWGRRVDRDVIPEVIVTLLTYRDHREKSYSRARPSANRQGEEITVTTSSD